MDTTTFTSDTVGANRQATIRNNILLGAVLRSVSSYQQHLMDDAAAAAAAAATAKNAAKENSHEHNKDDKAAPKRKMTNLIAWMGGGIISLIMMAIFSSTTTPFVTFSLLIHPSDASSEGKAPPALPPTISKPLRQRELQSDDAALTSPNININSPSAAVTSPSPSILLPAATSVNNRRLKCFDTPNWKDGYGRGCDYHEDQNNPSCDSSVYNPGDMGPPSENCCYCGKKVGLKHEYNRIHNIDKQHI
eukprot:CAMPEP_0201699276 /NCGR_PEP_ID=MMETSP0578-20130828/23091_1 /ASSEMBLY_ACC=CAM_ASM_000663 /TAXON_ID=267565 /ORGANISM="Skeletonema grethea, Strain CCMP 1804" /LENGTH=247 /DNA_ID=CAMNT_0048186005 /DNA_START=86 /DNA_END=829 /DNA_ORIENTATION=-